MCGVLVHCCLKYGVWDTNHLKNIPTLRYHYNATAYNVGAAAIYTSADVLILIPSNYSHHTIGLSELIRLFSEHIKL